MSGRRAATLATSLVVLSLAVGVTWWRGRQGSPARPSDATAPVTLQQAHERALALMGARHPYESLPYFRRQLQLLPRPNWAAHLDYASALHNASLEAHEDGPVTRSSFERAAMLRESFRQLEMAERLATRPQDVSRVLENRTAIYWLWGMPWDAVALGEQALAGGDASSRLRARHAARLQVLANPTHPGIPLGEVTE